MLCKNCGALLWFYKCEYCGTDLIKHPKVLPTVKTKLISDAAFNSLLKKFKDKEYD